RRGVASGRPGASTWATPSRARPGRYQARPRRNLAGPGTRRGRRGRLSAPGLHISLAPWTSLCRWRDSVRERGPLAPSGVTVGVRGGVSALETHLMDPQSLEVRDEELRVEGDAAVGLGVELGHPGTDAVGVEL